MSISARFGRCFRKIRARLRESYPKAGRWVVVCSAGPQTTGGERPPGRNEAARSPCRGRNDPAPWAAGGCGDVGGTSRPRLISPRLAGMRAIPSPRRQATSSLNRLAGWAGLPRPGERVGDGAAKRSPPRPFIKKSPVRVTRARSVVPWAGRLRPSETEVA